MLGEDSKVENYPENRLRKLNLFSR
jgi:hypothetical protein